MDDIHTPGDPGATGADVSDDGAGAASRRRRPYVDWLNRYQDVLPVTAPDGRVAEGSRLKAASLGKAPGVRKACGGWVGLRDWGVGIPMVPRGPDRGRRSGTPTWA